MSDSDSRSQSPAKAIVFRAVSRFLRIVRDVDQATGGCAYVSVYVRLSIFLFVYFLRIFHLLCCVYVQSSTVLCLRAIERGRIVNWAIELGRIVKLGHRAWAYRPYSKTAPRPEGRCI